MLKKVFRLFLVVNAFIALQSLPLPAAMAAEDSLIVGASQPQPLTVAQGIGADNSIPAPTTATTSNPAPIYGTPPRTVGNAASAKSLAVPVGMLPNPPPATAFATDPKQLANQAEQAALQAQAEADAVQAAQDAEHNRKSFGKAENGLLPLSPEQIRDFMRRLEQTQEASQPPTTGAPHGQVRISTISLDPGVEPPQVNLAAGYVTTITMVDSTGEPWPILDVGVGGNFEVSPTQAGSHVVRVMPLTRYGAGNLSVLLKDLPTPVIFRLSSGGPSVDLRYDARIGRLGPGARTPLINRPRLSAGDSMITSILENSPPKEAKRLKVSGLDARTMAWGLGEKVYVRTPLTLLSPAWNASIASADGTTVYEIGDAPVLLMSDNGAMVRAQISRDDDHDK